MQNNYTVYMHIFPNKKRYIGITMQTVGNRWQNGLGYRNTYIGNAIKKYGWENIAHEILFEHLTKEEAEQKEIELIAHYKTNEREFGYNIAKGGMHKGKCSEETKEKISLANSREKNGMFGKSSWNKGLKMNDETRKKLSSSLRGRKIPREVIEKAIQTRKNRFPNGYTYTEIAMQNIKRVAKINIKRAIEKTKKGVKQYDLNGNLIAEYYSISQASRETGISISNISHVCLKRKGFKTAGNYIWRYSDDNQKIVPDKVGRHRNIIQYDLEGNFIKRFTTIKEASNEINIGTTQIIKCCQNKGKTAGGYKWEYE